MNEIVQANLKHLDDVTKLFDAYRVFYRQTSDLSAARSFVQQRLEQRDSVIFVVYRGTVAAGFTQLYPTFSSVQMKRVWILNDLYVDPEFRQSGVAESLMEQARGLGIETKSAAITLQTATDNINAQSLYHKLGYKKAMSFYQYRLGIE